MSALSSTALSVIALAAIAGFALFAFLWATRAGTVARGPWMLPAALSLAFLCWSLVAVVTEGPLGFWHDHVEHLWSIQIYFDLLLGIGVAWFFLVPRAKTVGMNPLPWLLLTLCTGSIGLLATLARLLYLQERDLRDGAT